MRSIFKNANSRFAFQVGQRSAHRSTSGLVDLQAQLQAERAQHYRALAEKECELAELRYQLAKRDRQDAFGVAPGPIDIEVTKRNPGEPEDEQATRDYLRAFDLISATVHDHLVDLDAMTIANALFSVAANVLHEAGMSHADVARLLDTLADLSRRAEVETREPDA